ncbi:sigma-70 family RNA polymerase sigma factor [Actinomycetes bacterium KLBMP 9797]
MRRAPDDEAWLADLWSGHRSRVVSFLRRVCDAGDAEELAERTFVEAWRRRDEVPDAPLPWLFRIAHRLAHDRGAPPYRPEAHRGESARVAAACTELTDTERASLMMFVLDGFTDDEVAGVLGLDPDAARRERHRAREKLRHAVGAGA